MLVTLGVLAVLAAVVLVALPSSTKVPTTLPTTPTTAAATTTGKRTPQTTTTTSPGIPLEAVRAECQADFETITEALAQYETLEGAKPAAGDAWAIAGADRSLQTWPSSPEFQITWTGVVLRVTPWHHLAVATGSSGTASPPTGCDAV